MFLVRICFLFLAFLLWVFKGFQVWVSLELDRFSLRSLPHWVFLASISLEFRVAESLPGPRFWVFLGLALFMLAGELLSVSGQSDLGVSGVAALGVSGTSDLGWSNLHFYTSQISSELALAEACVSGLYSYLSQTMSDTSSSNHVQVVLLGLDSNNRYISPSSTVITNVQAKLDSLADAVVTVNVVDGISKVVPVDIQVELGISQTAVIDDVEQNSTAALTSSSEPFGLLVRRSAGKNLYISEIIQAIRDKNQAGDLVFINAKILSPVENIDPSGNLLISKQEIIQDGLVSVKVKKRLLINGDLVNV